MDNLPADFREEEELSPEEQVRLEEAREDDMDDDSDDMTLVEREMSEEEQELERMAIDQNYKEQDLRQLQ